MYNSISNVILDEMIKIFSGERVITDRERLEIYSHDEVPGFEFYPEVAVFPESSDEVSALMKLANEYLFTVTPRGAGTGLSGGALPLFGGVIVSFEKMNRILDLDEDNLMIEVEPGVITGDLQKLVESYGLFYPPDPASLDNCSIGGNLAECAGGPRAVKYGTTKDYVTGLEFVSPTGDICRVGGKLVKDVTGYNLLGLLIGSEGTLGLITKITLRLLPKPGFVSDLLVPFKDIKSAISVVPEIIKNRILPSTIEFLDRESIKAYREYIGKPVQFEDAEAHLIIQLDGPDKESIEQLYEKVWDICEGCGAYDIAVADTPQDRERLWYGRRSLLDSLKALSPVIDVEDVVVPRSRIPVFVEQVCEIAGKFKIRIANFGHAGDGNVHVNILKADKSDEEWESNLPVIKKLIFEFAVKLGGEISGEHGIGYVKKDYMSLSTGKPELELMMKVKRAFDPNNILNPGKIFE
ncbi:MAG TPA: FAD-binding protein [Firmicutes bacterium]|nr:FAD-binding protein [Bacillota bacterium]